MGRRRIGERRSPIFVKESIDIEENTAPVSSSTEIKLRWLEGTCKPGLCRGDAACVKGPQNTHRCVCPSDYSTPSSDDHLCKRKVVPLTPRPILNIIPPISSSSSSSSSSNISIPTNSSFEVSKAPSGGIQPLGGALLVVMAVIALSVIAVGSVCWWKRKLISKCTLKDRHRKQDTNPSPLSLSKGLLGNYVANPQYMTSSPALSEELSVPILPRDSLVFVQEIGEGCFGKVFKGEYIGTDNSVEVVAIKVLKESATKQAEEDFMREVEIMSSFRHANILSLIGIVAKEPDCRPCMVFEFMPHGDLAEVLRSNSKQLWKPIPGLEPLTKTSLLKIALQIACGMRYLAAQRFVHNDLACRNCLVGNTLTVKIADFGMSRDIYTCDYYRIGGSRPVPLRWMSPESVMYRRFTLESDVWSYGVVLWEIYSLGKQPYYGLNNEEVIKLILQGIMLIPPEGCPAYICDIMRACWKSEPKDRIRFEKICNRLQSAWDECINESNANVCLPRPPVMPVCVGDFNERKELLDKDFYLKPENRAVPEYLRPLPD